MHSSTLIGLAASIAAAQAVYQGFNCGNMLSDGYTPKTQDQYQAEFEKAQNLPGTSGWNSARLYTMIQGGTIDTPIAAIQAAIDTQTSLLLGMWCSAGEEAFQNELNALEAAMEQYGDEFTSLVVGISVGSEDLYRVSPTGIENDSGLGSTPNELVSYIKQTRAAIQGTSLSGTPIGHVDTWTAYVNGSNSAVIDACDWLGMDTYPYFQSTVDNSIEKANQTFWDAYDATAGAGNGKEVWITETGWPVSGKTVNKAVPSVENAETYWQEVACALEGKYNTWWFTLQDADPTTPNPSFGIVGSDLSSEPMYDLSCKKQKPTSHSGHSSGGSSNSTSSSHSEGGGQGNGHGHVHGGSSEHTPYPAHNGTSGGGYASPSATGTMGGAHGYGHGGAGATGSLPSASGSLNGPASTSSGGAAVESATGNAAVSAHSPAIGAGILAIFGLVAAL